MGSSPSKVEKVWKLTDVATGVAYVYRWIEGADWAAHCCHNQKMVLTSMLVPEDSEIYARAIHNSAVLRYPKCCEEALNKHHDYINTMTTQRDQIEYALAMRRFRKAAYEYKPEPKETKEDPEEACPLKPEA